MKEREEKLQEAREYDYRRRHIPPTEPPKITQADADRLLSIPEFRDQYIDLVLSEHEQAIRSGANRIDARKKALKAGELYLRVMAQPPKGMNGGNHIGKQLGYDSLARKIRESA